MEAAILLGFSVFSLTHRYHYMEVSGRGPGVQQPSGHIFVLTDILWEFRKASEPFWVSFIYKIGIIFILSSGCHEAGRWPWAYFSPHTLRFGLHLLLCSMLGSFCERNEFSSEIFKQRSQWASGKARMAMTI